MNIRYIDGGIDTTGKVRRMVTGSDTCCVFAALCCDLGVGYDRDGAFALIGLAVRVAYTFQ